MIAWTSVGGTVALAALVLLLPGLLVGALAGLRGLLLLGLASPLSVAVIATSAVLAPMVGVSWSWRVPAVGTLVSALAVAIIGWALPGRDLSASGIGAPALLGMTSRRQARADRPALTASTAWVPGLIGAAIGGALITVLVRRAIPSPSLISQAYDIVFHLNAVRWILDTGDASSLHLGRVTSPGTSVPYPAAWHDVVSLVVQLSGSSILVATNVVALVACAMVWPLSAVALAAQLTPRSPWVVAAAGVASAAFPAFPTLLLVWGVLYPTLLGYAMIPAALALLLVVMRRDGATVRFGTATGLALLAIVAAGLALAHPSVLFALVVVAGPLLVVAGVRWTRRAWASPATRTHAVTAVGVAAVLVALAAASVARSSVIAGMSRYSWPATASVPQAVGEALANAAPGGLGGTSSTAVVSQGALWASLLALVGVRRLLREGRDRWLVAGWVGVGALYVVGEATATNPLTGVWYNDAYRLAPLVSIVSLPLAAIGAGEVCGAAARWVSARFARRRGVHPLVAAASALLPLAVVVLALVAPGSGLREATHRLRTAYDLGPSSVSPLASADELALYARIDAEVPPGAVIANDPYDGSSLVMALADRQPLFTHFTGSWTPRQDFIAAHLDRVGTDPAVCSAVRAEHVTYLLSEGQRYFDWLPRASWFDGIRAAPASGAFTLVDSVGDARLFRLTTCAGADPQPAPAS